MDAADLTLEQDPFGPSADARYVYLNRAQEELLVALVAAVGAGSAKLLVTGGEGSGKSAFLGKLAEVLYSSGDVVLLGRETVAACRRDTSLEALEAAVHDETVLRDDGDIATKPAVLLLDDADRLDPSVLDAFWQRWPELNQGWPAMSVVMTAMPQPKQLHARGEPSLLVADRMFALPPMKLTDVERLISHRLKAAGFPDLDLFTAEALDRIAYFSKKVPGRIVQLCGYIFGRIGREFSVPISGDAVKEAAYHLFLPGHLQKLARGLAVPPRPAPAGGDSEAHREAEVSPPASVQFGGFGGRAEPAHPVNPRAHTARKGTDSITMPPPPFLPKAGAAATATSPGRPQPPSSSSRRKRAALFATAAGVFVMLSLATVMVIGYRQGDQRVERTVEATIASPASPGAEADLDAAPAQAAAAGGHDEPSAPPDEAAPAPAQTGIAEVIATPEAPSATGSAGQARDAAQSERADDVSAADPALAGQGPTRQPPADRALADQAAADQALAAAQPRRPPPLSELNNVALVQSQLNLLGYAAGPVDGVVGPRTRAAIRRFQADTGLPVDGRINDALIASLRRQSARANLQAQGRTRSRRRIPPVLRLRLDRVKSPQEFQEYCRANNDTWV
jgi:type II secretory pathway predicted ATPase ExeA